MDDRTIMTFAEAMREGAIDVFDKECIENLKAYKTYSDLWIQEYTAPVVSEYLNHLRIYELDKFNKIMDFVLENYLESVEIDRRLHAVSSNRDNFTVIEGGK